MRTTSWPTSIGPATDHDADDAALQRLIPVCPVPP
jgi:hypothetical protein